MRRWMLRFMVWAFERFYHEGAWTYDLVAWVISHGYWRDWATVILDELRDLPLLELGCGTGYVQYARRWVAPRTIGLDESPQMLRLTQRRLQRAGSTAPLTRAVGQALPFPDASWPIILATFPAPYLFDPRTLDEIRRVLEPDGRLIIIDGGVLPRGWYAVVVATIYRVLLGSSVVEQATVEHRDPRIERLQSHGFTVELSWRSVGRSQVQVVEARP